MNCGFRVTSTAGQQDFDRVVVTAPPALAARFCSDLAAPEKARLQGLLYQGIVCASVVLKKPLNGCYLTYIADPGIPFTAVIEMSALTGRERFGGRTLVYLPRYVPVDDPWHDKTDAEIEALMIPGLLRMYPSLTAADIEAFRVSRVRHVLPIATRDYTRNLPPMTTSQPGLFLVNSSHIVNGTLNVNETIKLADDAMATLLGASATASARAEIAA